MSVCKALICDSHYLIHSLVSCVYYENNMSLKYFNYISIKVYVNDNT